MEKVVRVDMDGVIADLQTPWLNRINEEFGCNVCVDDLTSWNMGNFLPAAASKSYHKHLHDLKLYEEVEPYPGALEGIGEVRRLGYHVLFVTSSTPAGAYGKMRWLKVHGFTPQHEYIPADFISAHKKKYVMPGTPLVDDGLHNLEGEEFGILFDQPWNRSTFHARRVFNWEGVVGTLRGMDAVQRILEGSTINRYSKL